MTNGGNENKTGRRIGAINTTCEILNALRDLDGAGISKIASETGHSKATVHSHLATLVDNEFVVKRGNKYEVSLKFFEFGAFAKNQIDIYEIAKQEVNDLAEETGEVSQFMVEEHGRGVYMHKARGENAIQTRSYAGNRKDLHCTALGKAILSQFSQERVKEIAQEQGLPSQTENTITSLDRLLEELETIHEENVAFDDEEVLKGLRCVAAPIIYDHSNIQGAISISGPTSQFKGERFNEELPEIVRSAANVIEVNATQV